MKRLALLLSIATLLLLNACHPSSPKTTPAKGTASQPSSEPASTLSGTATATASPTVSSGGELAPAPLIGPGTSSSTATSPAAGTTALVPVPSTRRGIQVLAPEGQISEDFRRELGSKLGAEVTVETYATAEEALHKLSTSGASYNLALVSYRIVPALVADQKLAALPLLPVQIQPAPKFLHHFFDRENKYSLPYAFSLTGLAMRKADVKVPVVQWKQLFSEPNYKLAALPEDEAFRNSLLSKAGLRGASLPSGAKDNGDEQPIQVNSVAVLKKKFAAQPGWQFVLPAEGSVIFLYCAVIPANVPQPERSNALLQTFFDPELVARLAEENNLGVTQPAAMKLLPPATLADGMIYPRNDILDKCIFIRSGYRPIPAPAVTPSVAVSPAPGTAPAVPVSTTPGVATVAATVSAAVQAVSTVSSATATAPASVPATNAPAAPTTPTTSATATPSTPQAR